METTVHTDDETRRFAHNLLTVLKGSAKEGGATVLTLSGPLGAGKTALTKHLAAILGVTKTVTSPTFVLRCDYDTQDPLFRSLVHIDAYRLNDSEAPTIGWEEVLSMPDTLVIVEWPEHIASHIPPHHIPLTASVSGTTRSFTVPEQSRTAV